MNHPDDDDELFHRLEAEMTAGSGAEVVDLGKARSARSKSPDSPTHPGADRSADSTPDRPHTESADPAGPTGPVDDEPDDDARRRVPVDSPDLLRSGVVYEKRRPILPPWLATKTEFALTARHFGVRTAYTAAYHSIRTPWYGLRLAVTAPRGGIRFASAARRWVWDTEAEPLRAATLRDEDVSQYLTLSRQRDRRVRGRTLVMLLACVTGPVLALALYVMAPGWLTVLAMAAVAALGFYGQEKDHPIIGPAVLRTEVEKLTGTIVLRALDNIGDPKICAAIKKGGDMNGMHFVSEIVRDGPGYRADLDLPYGVTPEDIMESRKELASGLRRKVGCVWPSADPGEHEGRLILWVGDRPMNETTKPAWPLLKSGTVDLFKPAVFGNDQRMGEVSVTLMFAAVVVGSIPRMGKTFLMRLLLLIAALDPRAELHAFDFKGTGDFKALEPVCHRYRAGEEDEDIEYLVATLRELKEELRRRAKVIKSLPTSRCPESKVTPELANDKSLRLHPIVAGFDECQVPFEHEKYGKEIEAICTDLTKRGPALGMVVMFGTQRPDAKSLPPGISNNAVLRFCLKVMGHQANDMVLGSGMNKAGYQATMFSRSDRGICWMAGEGDDPRIVSSAFVDAVAAGQVVARARVMREKYGNITGHAIGQAPAADTTPVFDLLKDVLSVVPADEKKVWNEKIAARLADLRPAVYGTWKGETVTANLKPHGITAVDVWGTTDAGKGTTRRGTVRADLLKAITERDGK
ncbi:FtsK/SpoIIIE domain-containing protein [Streptomyces sp. ICBB 8177]|uniref:FtsK/SpoIIIE domain-containing protein n=1 Tax=Streptomyces sp. ICBB 8177 TaxID=563922 RepID=UPI000D677B96|nr:FtsK/SpoIIIE domain-containing protein [Streptomyces sp. ICBB 8177]PWI43293.1 cell division protein FtsK [Streptomyces sp. ICBB 8177]